MYYASLDGENFNIGPTAEKSLAYAWALDELDEGKNDTTVWVGERVDFVPHIDAGDLLERLSEDASEHCGEASDGWPCLNSIQEKGLEQSLNNILSVWLESCGEKPTFFGIKNVEQIDSPPNATNERRVEK